MRRTSLAGLVVLLLALDWAALHDILQGEPDPTAEWMMVGFSLVVFGLLAGAWVRRARRRARA